ncbi:uncharacterized protein LOC129225299 [Uloborus diversus]|uniref:uncharacterized protein LOC129225299 n=1 Tax=Uloborus diversus TaxID=327109 RepID=UPI00240994A3|nr:uncharacterized protein LOC129225299 [Uloborus diversus]
MVKMIFVIVVSVLGCAVASPVCTNEESQKCVPEDTSTAFLEMERPWTYDGYTLDAECPDKLSIIECGLAFSQRCYNTSLGAGLTGFQSLKDLYDKLCDKSSAFRTDYLEHIICLNEQIEERSSVCTDFLNPPPGTTTCSAQFNSYKYCVEMDVKQSCGEKATKVFKALYAARLSLNIASCEFLEH